MNTVEGYVAPPTDLKNGDAGRQRKLTAAALLDWYASMGCTDVVADFGTDWPAKQNQPPGLEIREALANRQSDRSETYACHNGYVVQVGNGNESAMLCPLIESNGAN
ncbi:MAG: hypothetical protein AAFR75_06450 [Pseudomonadota bacterium]